MSASRRRIIVRQPGLISFTSPLYVSPLISWSFSSELLMTEELVALEEWDLGAEGRALAVAVG